jgi:hypothetical protein
MWALEVHLCTLLCKLCTFNTNTFDSNYLHPTMQTPYGRFQKHINVGSNLQSCV